MSEADTGNGGGNDEAHSSDDERVYPVKKRGAKMMTAKERRLLEAEMKVQ